MGTVDKNSNVMYSPERIASEVAYIRKNRSSTEPFDIAVDGVSKPEQHSLVSEYVQAGATWWFEAIHLLRGTYEELVQCIKAGPPVE